MKCTTSVGALLSATAALLLLSACSGGGAGSGETGAEEKSGTIQFVASQGPERYQKVIDAFEQSHPGIKVEYSQVPFDKYNPVIQQRLQDEDKTIDVYAVEQVNAGQYAAQGFLADLSDLGDKTKKVVAEDVYDSMVYDDKLYALPMLSSTQMMFYNKTLLDAAGVPHPSTDPEGRLTWQQVTEDAKKAQAAGAKWGLMVNQPDTYYQLKSVVESAGGGPGIGGKQNLEVDITGDEWVDVLDWYGGLYADGVSPRGIGGFETGASFFNGEMAYYVTGPWNLSAGTDSSVDWGVAPLPQWEGGEPVTPANGWVFGLNPASEHQKLAREFMEFASLDTEGATELGIGTNEIPGNLKAAPATLDTLEQGAGPGREGVADLMEYELNNTATVSPVSVGFPQFLESANRAVTDVRNGQPAAETLKKAQGEIETAWKRLN